MRTLEEFKYHEVKEDTAKKIASIRFAFYELAMKLNSTLPESRSKSLSLTYLEDSSMRAIQALAISEGKPIEP